MNLRIIKLDIMSTIFWGTILRDKVGRGNYLQIVEDLNCMTKRFSLLINKQEGVMKSSDHCLK